MDGLCPGAPSPVLTEVSLFEIFRFSSSQPWDAQFLVSVDFGALLGLDVSQLAQSLSRRLCGVPRPPSGLGGWGRSSSTFRLSHC